MKILLINSKLYSEDKGGPQKVFHDLIKSLENIPDIELFILTERGSEEYKKIYSCEIHFLFLDKPKGLLSFFKYQYGFYKLIRGYRANFFDIAHFQNFPGGKFLLTAFALKTRSKYHLLTVHDWILSEIKYHSFLGKITHLIHWVLTKFVLRNFDKYIVFSDFISKKLEKYLGSSKNIEKLYIGLDNDILEEKPKVVVGEKYILGYGGLNKKKGYRYLIEAYSEIHTRIAHKLLIGGNGPEELALKKLVCKYGLEEKVSFIGFINGNKKLQYIRNADIIVHPAEYEGYGIAILESLIFGNIIITGDIGGQTEFKNDFRNIRFFKSKDATSLKNLIIQVIDNNLIQDHIAINADVKSKYKNSIAMQLYKNMYEQILN